MGYIERRYNELVIECKLRGFQVEDKSDSFQGIPKQLMNDWEPTPESILLIRNRIKERLSKMKHVKFYGNKNNQL